MKLRSRRLAITGVVLVAALFTAIEISEFIHHRREQHYLDPNSYYNYSPDKAQTEKMETRKDILLHSPKP